MLDFAAPGQDLIGAYPLGPDVAASWSGTSFSTGLLTGAYALVRERFPLLQPEASLLHIAHTSDPQVHAQNPEIPGEMGRGPAGSRSSDRVVRALASQALTGGPTARMLGARPFPHTPPTSTCAPRGTQEERGMVWPTRRARQSQVLVLLVLTLAGLTVAALCLPAGCERDGAASILPQVDLPSVRTVGTVPEGTWTVTITAEGDLWFRGQRMAPMAWGRLLAQLTKDIPREGGGPACPQPVLLRLDASLPWIAALHLMMRCAAHDVGIYRIYLAARAGPHAGAIAMHLPLATWAPHQPTRGVRLKAFWREERPVPTPVSSIAQQLHQLRGPPEVLAGLELATPPPHGTRVPAGLILSVLDRAWSAGYRACLLDAVTPHPGTDTLDHASAFAAWLRAQRATSGAPYFKLGNDSLSLLPVRA